MSAVPALRSDLVIKEQIVQKVKGYIFKDPIKQAYYRFEAEEHFVLTHLDGKRTAANVAALYNQEFNDELTGRDIQEFIVSVRSMQLFEKTAAEQNTYLYEKLKEQRRSRILQAQGSILYFRFSFWDPDQFFNKVMPYIRWIWAPWCVVVMNLFMAVGLILLMQNYEIIQVGVDNFFNFLTQDLKSFFILWITVLSTIAIHELGHGLTCKRFGGECHEIGFLFMFFNPCMYANVNDAWLFSEKRHRLFVTFAGVYIECIVGFIAMYLWMFTQPGSLVNILSFQVVIVAFFSAIFMNFNPLMKFDGYFALSDALNMPNLRGRSQGYVKYLIQSKIFRLEREFDYLSRYEQWVLGLYGISVVVYLTYFMSTIAIVIGGMMIDKFGKAIGGMLTALLVYKVLGPLVKKFFGFLKVLMIEKKAFLARKSVRATGATLLVAILGICTFYPFSFRLEFESSIEPVRETVLRTLESGYVVALPHPHQLVFEEGDVMLRLKNDHLEQKQKNLKLDLQSNEMQSHHALAEGETTELLKLQELRKKLEKEALDLERRHQNLTLAAPHSGVLEQDLSAWEHTSLAQGTELARLVDPSVYKATFDVQERDMEGVSEGTKAYLSLEAQPWHLFYGEVTKIAVAHKAEEVMRKYQVTVAFPNEGSALRAGMEGDVLLDLGTATVVQRIARWFQKTIRLDLQF